MIRLNLFCPSYHIIRLWAILSLYLFASPLLWFLKPESYFKSYFHKFKFTNLIFRLSTMQTNLLNLWDRRKGFKTGWTTTCSNLKGILAKGQLGRYSNNWAKIVFIIALHTVILIYTICRDSGLYTWQLAVLFIFQKGFLGLCGERVDSIDYYREKISELDKKVRQLYS